MPLIYDHKLVLVDMIVQRTCNHDGKWGEEKHVDGYGTADNSILPFPTTTFSSSATPFETVCLNFLYYLLWIIISQ